MDKEDKEKIAEIWEESRRLKKHMVCLHVITLVQTLAILGMSYRVRQLEDILVMINHSLSDLVEITGRYIDIFIRMLNFLK